VTVTVNGQEPPHVRIIHLIAAALFGVSSAVCVFTITIIQLKRKRKKSTSIYFTFFSVVALIFVISIIHIGWFTAQIQIMIINAALVTMFLSNFIENWSLGPSKSKLNAFLEEVYKVQLNIINTCANRAVSEWAEENNFTKQYPSEIFANICLAVSSDINKAILLGDNLDEKKVSEKLHHEIILAGLNTSETFNENFSSENCSKITAKIINHINTSIPATEKFILPKFLRSSATD